MNKCFLLITGDRYLNDRKFVFQTLSKYRTIYRTLKYDITDLVHGDARGADRLSGEWAKANGIEVHPEPADWGTYGGHAGPLRNSLMLQKYDIDLAIAFLKQGSKGTTDMIKKLYLHHIPTNIVPLIPPLI